MPLRWQTSIETPAASLENQAEALTNTTYWGLLKQPDKQEVTWRKAVVRPTIQLWS
jgi:hypothetical protein